MKTEIDIAQHISANRIVGELLTREKYKFVDGRLIAEIVNNVVDMIRDYQMLDPKAPWISREEKI